MNPRNDVPLEDNDSVFGGKQKYEEKTHSKTSDTPVFTVEVVREAISLRIIWVICWISLGVAVAGSVYHMQFFDTLIALAAFVLSFVLRKKSKAIQYDIKSNYFSVNLSKTMRGFIGGQMKLKSFFPHAKTLAWISIAMLFMELIVFRHLLFYSLSTVIYAFASMLLVLSVLMLYSERNTDEASIIVGFFSASCLLAAGLASLFYGYLAGQNIVFGLVCMRIAEWLSKAHMTDIDLNQLRKETEKRNKEASGEVEDKDHPTEETMEKDVDSKKEVLSDDDIL